MKTRVRIGTRRSITSLFLVVVALAFAVSATSADAMGSIAKAAVPTSATGPTAAPVVPVATKLALSIGDAYAYHGRSYSLPRATVVIRGSIKATAALNGQTITVTVKKRGHTVRSENIKLVVKSGKANFAIHFKTGKRGKYVVDSGVPDALSTLIKTASPKSVSVIKADVKPGSSGVAVRLIQHELAALHYVTPISGHFDDATGRALIAFRKVTGLKRIPAAGSSVTKKLAAGKGAFHLKHPGAGRHVEVSIKKQVMAFADNGHVVRIYHVSTGKPSTPTIRGTFHVYRKDPGTNAKGMVHSSYFSGGYAIHGYADVPTYNASHGCVRVPIPSSQSIYDWISMGTRVDVYY